MLHYKYLHRSTFIRDALWLLAINGLLFVFFAQFDVLELIMNIVKEHEHWELDEFLPLGGTLAFSLVIFTYRRLAELGRVTQAFEDLAKRDPLTNALNRRAGQAVLYNFFNRANRAGEIFFLLQLNVDNFKRINDLYGPSVGDDILINLVNIIRQHSPVNSQLIHWHSDNFIIVLPASPTLAYEFANKLRKVIEQQLFSTDTITCSIGLAPWKKGLSMQDILHNAEDALLDAKAANKNTVKVA
ncbi:GGDEF domain-containing protein [Colwellia psychrerythraea]|uniref:diguanylate cyclase n=1 Tax=Colwellia psychrerythraea TaxID=28229 RepID=A0A099L3Y0_COLPS|nr:GGDEF domain-containing protein [Colwellia psychrerythraea]KGJ97649.1 diguanylate cyclase [Colwellia psychrerythraea]